MIAIIREKMRKLLPVLCGIVILFFMIYPYAKSASYSVFQGDDFSKAIFMKGSEQSLIHHLELCIKLLKQNYLERLGFYTSIILLGLFSPVNNLGLHGLGIVMFTNVWL